MKTHIMDTGSIEITEDDYGHCTVRVRLVDGNVWMTQYEIARLFGVYDAAVRNNLRTVFKSVSAKTVRFRHSKTTPVHAAIWPHSCNTNIRWKIYRSGN